MEFSAIIIFPETVAMFSQAAVAFSTFRSRLRRRTFYGNGHDEHSFGKYSRDRFSLEHMGPATT